MKTILIAGDPDSLPADEGGQLPKPMVDVGGRPLMTRVMDVHAAFGHTDFIVAAGQQSLAIKQFFTSYHLMANDVSVAIDTGEVRIGTDHGVGWKVSVVDTGLYSSNSARLSLLRQRIGPGPFMVSHAEGLGNIDIRDMLDFHRSHGKVATVAAVSPPARSGHLEMLDARVTGFSRTDRRQETWISSGFFIFNPTIFDYLVDDRSALEDGPLAQLAEDGELMAFRHHGFWQPLDTRSDQRELARLCTAEPPPWLQFDQQRQQNTEPKLAE